MACTWSTERRRLEREREAALRRQQRRDEAPARVEVTLSCTYCHAPLRTGDGRFCDQRCKDRWEDLTLCW
jgi:hypothetical protein